MRNTVRTIRAVSFLAAIGLAVPAAQAGAGNSASSTDPATDSAASARASLGRPSVLFPVRFEENIGQADAKVRFLSRGQAHALFLTREEAVLSFAVVSQGVRDSFEAGTKTLRLRLIDANSSPEIAGEKLLRSHSNYFIGSNPEAWHRGIRNYRQVRYQGVYPGIDMLYYATSSEEIEYDFIVAPGADPSEIAFAVVGAKNNDVDSQGHLVLDMGQGHSLRLRRPVAYQEIDGLRSEIAVGYKLGDGREVSFDVAEYDEASPLIIDPIIEFGTYLGGSEVTPLSVLYHETSADSIAYFSPQRQFIGLQTNVLDFPWRGDSVCSYTTYACQNIVLLDLQGADVDAAGDQIPAILNATYFGGRNYQSNARVKVKSKVVDGKIRVYLVGRTTTWDTPDMPIVQTLAKAVMFEPAGKTDIFLMVLDIGESDASVDLVYSTYLGGTGSESQIVFSLESPLEKYSSSGALSMDVDDHDRVYIGGTTGSRDFPVRAPGGGTPHQSSPACDPPPTECRDGFVSIIDLNVGPGNDPLFYSTYFGGPKNPDDDNSENDEISSGDDEIVGIAHSHPSTREEVPFFYVVGSTRSKNLPIATAAESPLPFDFQCGSQDIDCYGGSDGFLAVINPEGKRAKRPLLQHVFRWKRGRSRFRRRRGACREKRNGSANLHNRRDILGGSFGF